MVWRLISNNYYSILLNGQSYGFFHSTRGVKQGDPLSPTLFILSNEVLCRALNSLFDDPQFVGYGMPKWSANLNHLAYADDTIIFSSTQNYSLGKIMTVLQDYEKQSGQKVNKEKSFYYLHQKVAAGISHQVEQCTGMSRDSFPMIFRMSYHSF
uniref:Putative ovule protein n=1 Tax=Solanum chacoense TaxID=4108 RepID=A0A0V0HYL8_SOLCH